MLCRAVAVRTQMGLPVPKQMVTINWLKQAWPTKAEQIFRKKRESPGKKAGQAQVENP